jgi:ferredoxin
MICNYGYSDASGDYFITIDTEKCDACGFCALNCPSGVFAIVDGDPLDPLDDKAVAIVNSEINNKLCWLCAECKSDDHNAALPCIVACEKGAITHSW